MTIREMIAVALQSRHLETRPAECAIDRIGAFAHAPKLGRLLWRWLDQGEPLAHAVLEETLRKARRRFQIHRMHRDYPRLEKCARQALLEFTHPFCPTCRGLKEERVEERVIVCPHCRGSGLKRWSELERQAMIGSENYPVWGRRVDEILGMLAGASAATSLTCRVQLERKH